MTGARHNLPAELSSFVGRAEEIEALRRLVAPAPDGEAPGPIPRLVTLAGPGGIGKTRLALRVAAAVQPSFTDGAWLVELAPVADPAQVPAAAAAALGLVVWPERPPAQALANVLRDQQVLVILDNCEHLSGACAALATALLRACPDLRILATSREPLGVEGEMVWRVTPLALPAADAPAARADAVRLFVERARAAVPGFTLSEGNAATIADICRRLDGIPLAIELAAARLKVLGLDQLPERLADRFRLLAAGPRAGHSRHQTLRATIDWSYHLLDEPERALFARLAIFRGGFSLEAAEQVCDFGLPILDFGLEQPQAMEQPASHGPLSQSKIANPKSKIDVLDLLSRLVDKSLVLAEPEEGSTLRYRLLETLREYTRERLEERGEVAAVAAAHAGYFVALAERAAPELHGPQQIAWARRLDDDRDNLRAALDWLCERGKVEGGLRLGAALWWYWEIRGLYAEARDRLAALVKLSDSAPGEHALWRGHVLANLGHFAGRVFGDFEANETALMESLHIFQSLGDLRGEAVALWAYGCAVAYEGAAAPNGDRRNVALEASLQVARKSGDVWQTAASLNPLGVVRRDRREYDEARRLLEEALDLRQRLGDTWGIAMSLSDRGHLHHLLGDNTTARADFMRSLALRRALGDSFGTHASLLRLAAIAVSAGDHVQGRSYLDECRAIARRMGSTVIVFSQCLLGILACEEGELKEAQALFTGALRTTEPTPVAFSPHARIRGLRAAGRCMGTAGTCDETWRRSRDHARSRIRGQFRDAYGSRCHRALAQACAPGAGRIRRRGRLGRRRGDDSRGSDPLRAGGRSGGRTAACAGGQ